MSEKGNPVLIQMKSPAEPGCKQNLFRVQSYFASLAI